MSNCAENLRAALAGETGRIMGSFEIDLKNSDDYIFKYTKKGAAYNPGMGEGQRGIRYNFGRTDRRIGYQKFLPNGDTTTDFPARDCAGNDTTIEGTITKAASCNIPATRLDMGFTTYERCPVRKKVESPIICPETIIQNYNPGQYIVGLQKALKRDLMEGFAEALEDSAINLSFYKTSVTASFTTAEGINYFPAIPEGILSIGTLKNLVIRMKQWGFMDGLGTPRLDGKSLVPVATSETAWEQMIEADKKDRGVELASSVALNDGEFGNGQAYRGFMPIFRDFPIRGWLKDNGIGHELVRVYPLDVQAGNGGVVEKVNDDYHSCKTVCNGETHTLYEVGLILHPDAMERQPYNSSNLTPGLDAKNGKLYSSEVVLHNDPVLYGGCDENGAPIWIPNEDRNQFKFTGSHAFAPYTEWPEAMAAFLYKASPDCIKIHDPCCPDDDTLVTSEITLTEKTELSSCQPCEVDDAETPLVSTCDDAYPADNAGIIKLDQCSYEFDEDATATAVDISVERVGGSLGAASVDYDVELPDTVSIASGTLNWADGEFGIKTITIDISSFVATDAGDVTLSNEVGAALAGAEEGCVIGTITIV